MIPCPGVVWLTCPFRWTAYFGVGVTCEVHACTFQPSFCVIYCPECRGREVRATLRILVHKTQSWCISHKRKLLKRFRKNTIITLMFYTSYITEQLLFIYLTVKHKKYTIWFLNVMWKKWEKVFQLSVINLSMCLRGLYILPM